MHQIHIHSQGSTPSWDHSPPSSLTEDMGQSSQYLFPAADGASFSHECVTYNGYEILFTTQHISLRSLFKEPTFTSLCDSEAVSDLIRDELKPQN